MTRYAINLTSQERIVTNKVLCAVEDNMIFEDSEQEYKEDYENFILCLSKEEMKALRRAIKKI